MHSIAPTPDTTHRLAVQVTVKAVGGTPWSRGAIYLTLPPARNAVRRAHERGHHVEVALVQLVPVGDVDLDVVDDLTGGAR
ncbi:hypothetical protein [Kineococcus sp. SYSU DK001]|uniref:hypothetical protein n=1 Tax=Kineococcus sp. SYSU DK001 TaxID=3383122 RepID=UPI003D7D220B